jgi:hypothetical protein
MVQMNSVGVYRQENGKFSVDSMCRALIQPGLIIKKWKMKIPLKIKLFAWYLCKGVILTEENLVMHNWHRTSKCVFYHDKNLFFKYKFARSIW